MMDDSNEEKVFSDAVYNSSTFDKSSYAVGDVNSNEKGTGARDNAGKTNWPLMPLNQVVLLIDNYQKIEFDKKAPGFSNVVHCLGLFQEGKSTAELVLTAAVAYHWRICEEFYQRPMTMFESLHSVIAVWEYGLAKYAPYNWAKGAQWSVPIGSAMRHLEYIFDGEDLDKESKQLHSAHVVCNAMMLVHYAEYWKAGDDRPLHVFTKES